MSSIRLFGLNQIRCSCSFLVPEYLSQTQSTLAMGKITLLYETNYESITFAMDFPIFGGFNALRYYELNIDNIGEWLLGIKHVPLASMIP